MLFDIFVWFDIEILHITRLYNTIHSLMYKEIFLFYKVIKGPKIIKFFYIIEIEYNIDFSLRKISLIGFPMKMGIC